MAPRSIWWTPQAKVAFDNAQKMQMFNTIILSLALGYLIAVQFMDIVLRLPFTLLFYAIFSLVETLAFRFLRRVLPHDPTTHSIFVLISKCTAEVFLVFMFPSVSSVWFFFVLFFVRVCACMRYAVLLSTPFWRIVLRMRNNFNHRKLQGSLSFKDKFNAFIFPVKLTRNEYRTRLLESFSYTIFSYIAVSVWYIIMASFMKWGYNRECFPYQHIPDGMFYLSLYYAAATVVGFTLMYPLMQWLFASPFLNIPFGMATRIAIAHINANKLVTFVGCITALQYTLGMMLKQHNLLYWTPASQFGSSIIF
eukprot:TRINITY_DN13127_c0_g1_i1.p1 TRINITY_DN13127_c0_g1~~TRINITY_DN13127_c0_g1_i1.p1  ORF type:complete len:355 (-),score=37.42 TRINITY_DN13127_c0_g1_i1:338-1261(-)